MQSQITMTISDTLFTRAKQLTQLRKTESEDELVDLLEQILASAEIEEEETSLDEDLAVEREMQAYIAMHPLLKQTHFGKHVAIYDGRLIDTDDDYDTLTRRIDTQYPDRFVWITTVAEAPIKMFVFRSPRLEQTG